MNRQRKRVAAGILLAVFGGITGVLAEVSSEVDPQGNYVRMVVLSDVLHKTPRIWSVQSARPDHLPLNPDGDVNGDSWPLILENPSDRNHPYVVWSRHTGAEYDLAWSRWLNGQWTEISWIEDRPNVAGDDLDPAGTIDRDGRAYVSWWRDEGGTGRIYVSLYLTTQWMVAYPVSEPWEDGRYPGIHVGDDGNIRVSYQTPEGLVTRMVVFERPGTITDELDPYQTMSVSHDLAQASGNKLDGN
jgi:hypothetical protein